MREREAQSQAVWSSLLAGMVGCLAMGVLPFVQALDSSWNNAYFPIACVLAALWGYFSPTTEGDAGRLQRLRVRLVHFTALVVGLQLYLVLAADSADRGLLFSHPQVAWYSVPLVLAGLLGRATASDLHRLGEPPEHDMRYVPPEKRLGMRILLGGAALFAVSGITHSDIGFLNQVPRASGIGSVSDVLAYFIFGTLMLGRVRYSVLRSRWEDRHMSMTPALGRQWMSYSLGLLLILALGTLAVSGHSYGLQDAPQALGRQVQNLSQLWHPSAPGSPSHRHYGRFFGYKVMYERKVYIHTGGLVVHDGSSNLGHPFGWGVKIFFHPYTLTTPAHPASPVGLVKVAFFAGVLLACAFLFYLLLLRFRVVKLGRRARWRYAALHTVVLAGTDTLAELFRALVRGLRRFTQTLIYRPRRPGIGDFPANGGDVGGSRSPKFMRPGSLGPREQAVYYYLNVLRRAKKKGLNRRGSQTPFEFENEMAQRLPEVAGDVEVLTQAFVEARYSRHTFGAEKLPAWRESWRRVTRALRPF